MQWETHQPPSFSHGPKVIATKSRPTTTLHLCRDIRGFCLRKPLQIDLSCCYLWTWAHISLVCTWMHGYRLWNLAACRGWGWYTHSEMMPKGTCLHHIRVHHLATKVARLPMQARHKFLAPTSQTDSKLGIVRQPTKRRSMVMSFRDTGWS